MDKRVIFAVAGSGKTTYIIDQLTLNKRFLILTYTQNNTQTLRRKIIQKFGYFPDNITLLSYFVFLHSFCYKPLLSYCTNSKGINWQRPPEYTLRLPRSNINFYLDKNKRLYHNRIAKFCEVKNILSDINIRIEKYFDCLYIDEIQDFAGHDFDLLRSIVKVNCDILFVGDFYQHTFDTSNDGKINKGLFNDYNLYKKQFHSMKLVVDTTTLQNSYRCSKAVCDFIQSKIGISISSSSSKNTNVIFIEKQSEANRIIENNSIVKLFYQESSKYNCHSQNWGSSKGIDHFNDVCVVLNKTTQQAFDRQKLSTLPSQTKNKLYVACSRARGNLYFISSKFVKKAK